MIRAQVVFHLPEAAHDRFRRMKVYAFYRQLEAMLLARGGSIRLEGRPSHLFTGETVAGDGDLHIVENGFVRGEGYLNATLAYLEGFWHLDPRGGLANSSIGALDYDPKAVDEAAARRFFAGLKARFAQARHSRYAQPRTVAEVPAGCIAVFLQGPAPQRQGQAHLSYEAMLRAVAGGARGRPVLVKPHPLKPEPGLAQIEKVRREGFDLIASTANVHDLLANACVSVSVNSATAIEGFLHGTPAILFGRSDFRHFVDTVHEPDGFAPALAAALAQKRDYACALFWYFGLHCLNLDAADFEGKVLAVFARAGFDAARLGLAR